MKKGRFIDMMLAVILIAVGIVLLVYPTDSLKWVILAVGVILIISGVLKLIEYLATRHLQETGKLLISVLYIAMGIFMLAFTGTIMDVVKVFAIVLSVFVMISLLLKFVLAIVTKTSGQEWIVSVLVTGLFFALSLIVLIVIIRSDVEIIIQMIGVLFLIDGILALLEALFPTKRILIVRTESIEAEVEENVVEAEVEA